MVAAFHKFNEVAEPLLTAIEESLAALRGDADVAEIVDQLQQIIDELRAALRIISEETIGR